MKTIDEAYDVKGNFEKRIEDKNNWIFLHLKPQDGDGWKDNRRVAIKQIPRVGENIFVDFQGPAYKVVRVDHTVFTDSEFDAEVWAKEISSGEYNSEVK